MAKRIRNINGVEFCVSDKVVYSECGAPVCNVQLFYEINEDKDVDFVYVPCPHTWHNYCPRHIKDSPICDECKKRKMDQKIEAAQARLDSLRAKRRKLE